MSGAGLGGAFDYGSVAVDNNGRVIVGAVKYISLLDPSQANGYWIRISPDGGNSWPDPPIQVVAPTGTDPRLGINSRVVAAGNQFYVFTPTLQPGQLFQPTSVSYYVENGGSWSGPNLIMQFAPPMNNSPAGTTQIYYAPLMDAGGNSSGTWAVTFQVNVGGYNQVMVCNAQGCWYVNPAADDEFMNGVSVGPEGGLWVSYLTYSSLTSRQLPLYHQTIYLPPGGGVLGVTGDYNVDPTSWFFVSTADRCSSGCYAMGDYARIGSNSYQGNPGVGSPYLSRSGSIIDMFQIFGFDPQGQRPTTRLFPCRSIIHSEATCAVSANRTRPKLWALPPKSGERCRAATISVLWI